MKVYGRKNNGVVEENFENELFYTCPSREFFLSHSRDKNPLNYVCFPGSGSKFFCSRPTSVIQFVLKIWTLIIIDFSSMHLHWRLSSVMGHSDLLHGACGLKNFKFFVMLEIDDTDLWKSWKRVFGPSRQSLKGRVCLESCRVKFIKCEHSGHFRMDFQEWLKILSQNWYKL